MTPRLSRCSGGARHCAVLFVALCAALAGMTSTLCAQQPLTSEQRSAVKQAEAARIAAIAKVYGTVVCIFGNDRQGGGSGVLFDPAGLALTNHHVVAGAGVEGWAGLADGKLYRWRAIGTDPGGDIAIIQLKRDEPFPNAALGNSDQVQVGDWAMAMGNPFVLAEDYHPTVTLGIVSGVQRYQPAGGKNQLIYGNCIQVDSSINPGNSGGPLFSMQSEVLGINGRGSFKERGRVNVGLGYAVSSKQIRNFIPDLLATKVAQHGTLDAQFTNRGGRVTCSTLDLDSQAAHSGLQLGDELVSFEGEKIADANEFTNLITTLPADWPVTMVCRREGKEFSFSVRLSPLPYTLEAPEEPEEKPAKRKEKPRVTTATDRTADPDKPQPPKKPRGGRKKPGQTPEGEESHWNLAKAGTITDLKLNRANASRVVSQWSSSSGAAAGLKGFAALRIEDEIRSGDTAIGKQQLLLGKDGAFRVDYTVDKTSGAAGFDGKTWWTTAADGTAKACSMREAAENPWCLQALGLSLLLNPSSLATAEKCSLDGSDAVRDRPAYRLRIAGAADMTAPPDLLFWLSLELDGNLQRHELLAIGGQIDPVGRQRQVLFSEYQPFEGISLPQHRSIVRNKTRETEYDIVLKQCRAEATLPKDALEMPKSAKP